MKIKLKLKKDEFTLVNPFSVVLSADHEIPDDSDEIDECYEDERDSQYNIVEITFKNFEESKYSLKNKSGVFQTKIIH